jgi:hypothetical protein
MRRQQPRAALSRRRAACQLSANALVGLQKGAALNNRVMAKLACKTILDCLNCTAWPQLVHRLIHSFHAQRSAPQP